MTENSTFDHMAGLGCGRSSDAEDDAEEIEQCPTQDIPEDNPFRDQIIDLASDGHSWTEIWELLEDAYDPVDRAAFEESCREETEA